MDSGGSMRRIRVLMVMPSYYPVVGGMEIQVERQIPHLRELGIDVSILTRQTNGAPRREVRDGVEIRRIPVPGGAGLRSIAFTSLGITDVLRHRADIDVIHAHSLMSPATIAALAGTASRTARFVTVHSSYETTRLFTKPLGKQRLRWFMRTMTSFVSISSEIRGLLMDNGVPPANIVSIPNGIAADTFSPVDCAEKRRLRAERGLPIDRPVAIFVGRLQSVKNVDVLLRAWAGIDNGQLVILGDGDQRSVLTDLAQSLHLGGRVEFRGMVSDVADYLRASDVFVLPSSSEGLSVALLEAMASGVVPIATAIGGAVDLITDGESGLLVSPGDVEGLRIALARAVTDADWRRKTAIRARQIVATDYDLPVVATKLANLYRGVSAD